MHQCAYKAEEIAFTPCVIKRCLNTEIFPWNPELILGKARLNAGNDIVKTKERYVNVMKQAAEEKMKPKVLTQKLQQGSAKLKASTAFNPFEIQQLAEEKEMAINEAKKAKIAKKQEAQDIAAAKCIARTCCAPVCNKKSQTINGSSTWFKCVKCGKLFCKDHGKEYQQHDLICNTDDNDNTINYVAV